MFFWRKANVVVGMSFGVVRVIFNHCASLYGASSPIELIELSMRMGLLSLAQFVRIFFLVSPTLFCEQIQISRIFL